MLNEKQIEELAIKIRTLLLDVEMWTDLRIYFNNKAFCTIKDDKFYYNDRDNLIVIDSIDPKDYFEFVADPHILSMSFEGDFCEVLNFEIDAELLEEFVLLMTEYGLYYELGNHWNLTCYVDEALEALNL